MKPNPHIAAAATLVAFAMMGAVPITSAATETAYWDGNDTDANANGGDGTWGGATTNWDDAATGGSDIAWDGDASGDDTAVFGGTAGTVTVSGPIDLNTLSFSNLSSTNKYTIDGGTLNFGVGGSIKPNFTNQVNFTDFGFITSAITGSPNIVYSGSQFNNQVVFAPASGSVALGTVSGAGVTRLAGSTTGNTLVGVSDNNSKIKMSSGTWTLTGTARAYEHFIEGGDFIIGGTGSLQNSSRSIQLNGGTLHYNHPGAVKDDNTGSGGDNDFRFRGGSLDNTSGAAIATSAFNPGMTWEADWTFIGSNGANSDLYLGNGKVVVIGATRQVTVQNAATTLSYGGEVAEGSAGLGITKAGPGTLVLGAVNSYTGPTTVTGGTLSIGDGTNNSNLGDLSVVSVDNGAKLDLNFSSGNPDTVLFLVLGGSPMAPGQYGHGDSGADNGGAGVGAFNAFFEANTGIINNTGSASGLAFWDGGAVDIGTDGDAASAGGNGTWDALIENWDKGFTAHDAWQNGNLDAAILGGAGGTITLGDDIVAGGIMSGSAYTINGGGNTLTLDVSSGTPVIDVPSNQLTINSVIDGNEGLQKDGAGTLRLSGENTFTGGVVLNAGDLFVDTESPYEGWGTDTLTINGGRIRTNSAGTFTTDNDSVWNASFGVYRGVTGTAVWNHDGNVTLGGNVTVTSANNFWETNIGGDIDETGGSRSLTIAGSGHTLTLDGANTFSGGLTYSGGATLKINHASALGSGPFTITNGTIDNTSGSPVVLNTANLQNWNANIAFTGSNDLNLGTGAVTINANRTVTVSAGTLTVGGGIGQSGTRTLTKNGNGTLVLGGANTYTGNTTVSTGTLALVGGSQNSAITVNSGATLGLSLNTGSPATATTTSTKSLTLVAGHAITVSGTVDNSSDYLLMTAALGITGTPADPGIPDYQLTIVDNGGVDELWLEYTGVGGAPDIAVDQGSAIGNGGSKDFGTHVIGTNADLVFTITNNGTADLNLTGTPPDYVVVGGTHPGDFSVTAQPSTPVSSGGGTTNLTVRFTPQAAGARSATITIASNDPVDGSFVINLTGTGQTAYEAWSNGGGGFAADDNGDGIDNGMAWLLGAADPNADATGLLPGVSESGGDLVLTFNCLPVAARGGASLKVAYSATLAGWTPTTNVVPDATGADAGGVVSYLVSGPSGSPSVKSVTATIDSSAAAGGKLFGRLEGTE